MLSSLANNGFGGLGKLIFRAYASVLCRCPDIEIDSASALIRSLVTEFRRLMVLVANASADIVSSEKSAQRRQ